MNVFQLLKFPQNLFSNTLLYFMLMATFIVSAQTTFTESAAAYGLDISGNKDGGHAWSDYDNDGDIDVLVLEDERGISSYLMRNNGNNTFTDVSAALIPGMSNDNAERQAAWGDLNNDSRPDFMVTSHGNSARIIAIQIYIQNPSGTFGDGIGGTTPITVGENRNATVTINPLNVEGAGFFDFEGDGDLDIFFDNHDYGIELLRNNYIDHVTHTVVAPVSSALFSHITTGDGAGVVQFGLNQFATDGDYGSAADVNDDGWVDIFMRKRDENDFFLNQGGTFTNGADLAQAENGNKGGNALWDLDNDGDLDAVWTENGLNQIFRNDGSGVWTALGAATFPGLPQPGNISRGSSSNDIDALAGGDIDNDGDIDILMVGDNRSYLFINQLNSPTPAPGVIGSGTAMTFSLDSETFNTRNGEGTTMIDIDDDGDLDIYMNIDNRTTGNQLFINNLPAANRNNHLLISVTEDRGANGSTGGAPERVAIGTNILIRDCNGNIISGLRQVNGVFGHGTQSPEEVHVGLPLGENETYVIEVRYPNFYDPVDGFTRLIGTIIATPSTIPGTNHYSLSTSEAELSENINAPDAVDDIETVAIGTTVSVQVSLFDNDSETDSESFFISDIVQPAIGSVVIDDAALGLVTYTYSAGTLFPGTTFDYTISDSPIITCPAFGKTDTATVRIYEPCTDPDGVDTDGDGINDLCDLDDDNDGILDCEESTDSVSNAFFNWNLNSPNGTLTQDSTNNPAIADWVLSSTGIYTWSGITATVPLRSFHVTNMPSSNLGEAVANNDYFQVTFTTDSDLINPELVNSRWRWFQPERGGDSYSLSLALSDDDFTTYEFTSTDVFATDPGDGSMFAEFDLMEETSFKLKSNTTYTARIYVYGQIDDSPENYSVFDDFQLRISACRSTDSDEDGYIDHLDLDSDNDGIYDAVEAGHSQSHSNGVVDGAVGIDGIPNAVQTLPNDEVVNYSLSDSDNDSNIDSIELDSDDDGCNDVLEAGFTDENNDGLLGSDPVTVDGNGLVTSGSDGYTVPADADSNSTYDFQEVGIAAVITTQPANISICPSCNGSFSVVTTNGDTFQWQFFNGASWVDLTNSGNHTGTNSATLTIINATPSDNGNQYRILVSSSTFVCISETSNTAILTVAGTTVITNRRITYRVKKN